MAFFVLLKLIDKSVVGANDTAFRANELGGFCGGHCGSREQVRDDDGHAPAHTGQTMDENSILLLLLLLLLRLRARDYRGLVLPCCCYANRWRHCLKRGYEGASGVMLSLEM